MEVKKIKIFENPCKVYTFCLKSLFKRNRRTFLCKGGFTLGLHRVYTYCK